MLAFKKIGLVRMLKNEFAEKAKNAETEGWKEDELRELLGEKREMMGIFEGNEKEGELEAGQSSGLVKEIYNVELLIKKLLKEVEETLDRNGKIIKR
jgi:enoyl-[acyl-carrier protein] reductase II